MANTAKDGNARVIGQLTTRGIRIHTVIHSRSQTGGVTLPGIRIIRKGFSHPRALLRTLASMSHTFLLAGSARHTRTRRLTFISTTHRDNIGRVIGLSRFTTSTRSPIHFLHCRTTIRTTVRTSKVACAFLHPGLFVRNLLRFGSAVADRGTFCTTVNSTGIDIMSIHSVTSITMITLARAKRRKGVCGLAKPRTLARTRVTRRLSTTLGHRVTFISVPSRMVHSRLLGVKVPP